MARRRRYSWLVALFAAALFLPMGRVAAEGGADILRLHVGEARQLSRPEHSDVQVSRRNVVDVTVKDPNSVRLVGLRSGVVVLTYVGVDGSLLHKTTVLVDPRSTVAAVKTNFPQALCRESGVRCDAVSGVISGVVTSRDWLRSAMAYCHRQRRCVLDIRLTEALRSALKTELRRALGARMRILPTRGAALSLIADCAGKDSDVLQKRIDAVTGDLASAGVVRFSCRDDLDVARTYVVRARLLAREIGEHRDVGLQPIFRTSTNTALVATFKDVLLWRASAEQGSRRSQILGEPLLLVREGASVEVMSGGEFKVSIAALDKNTDARTLWKKFGVSFKMRVDRVRSNLIKLRAEVGASERAGGGESLQINHLDTDLVAALGQVKLVGTIDVKNDLSSTTSLPWLAQVPILGPLLQKQERAQGNARLYVWVHVREDDAASLTPVAWPSTDERE